MLAIGRALMTNPRLLILDEATEGLAPIIRREIWAALAQLKHRTGMAIMVIDKPPNGKRSVSEPPTSSEPSQSGPPRKHPPDPRPQRTARPRARRAPDLPARGQQLHIGPPAAATPPTGSGQSRRYLGRPCPVKRRTGMAIMVIDKSLEPIRDGARRRARVRHADLERAGPPQSGAGLKKTSPRQSARERRISRGGR